jgi:hypothetical protein
MATRNPTITRVAATNDDASILVTWAGLLNGDVGAPVAFPQHTVRSFQVTGTFGAGGSINAEGSNDGTNFAPVANQAGSAITLTAAGIKRVEDLTQFLRPNVTAGDGTTSLVATALLVRPQGLRSTVAG